MHEFSLCQSVINIAKKAAENNSKKVSKVVVKIGNLAGVDVESFEFWFPVAANDSVLEQAKLEIIHEQAIAKCKACEHEFELTRLYEQCPNCGSFEKDILKGKDMLVESIVFN
ncbi:hydrogenase maturation nickel metallochaperone HypA [Francisella philomiragia]|uniref:hydrogenase maturation nickel metallochaperone HypA n=1 Tax=Francisella philomiragia TaxID=28110 RepID=UPI00190368F9|nr:hydrogenase maturation nickel metallochaperone HypA [Francisella philomiragia]MBK2296692.1 hydrogenase maturation nickel metallochaperone HypA [Francisella philomiragia]MBK2341159.1 hydrogenase maturation nickel metallochaperone HypA [Francisella philomiragia]